MAIVRPYPLGEEQARPVQGNIPERSGSLASFGQTQPSQVRNTYGDAADALAAGSMLQKASDNFAQIALQEARDANEAYVQDLNNQFIAKQQALLYTGDNAFYRQQGKNAIDGAPVATQQLLDLQKGLIDQTKNQYQKDRLTKILNGHVNEATNGISRFVAVQSLEWQKSVAEGRSALINNQARLENNNFDKINMLAADEEANARQRAQQLGLNGTPTEEAMVMSARSKVYFNAIDQAIQSGDPRRALSMYNTVKDKLDATTNDRLSAGMKSIATQVDAENWIADKMPGGPFQPEVKRWAPQVQKAAGQYGVDPVLALAVLKKESEGNPGAEGRQTPSGKAKGLMQIVDGTARDLGIKNVFDPNENINGGVKYLSQMLAKFNGNQRLALMAYNWGPGNVENWLKAGAKPDAIPAETQDYVQKVQGYVTAQQGVGFDKAAGEAVIKAAQDDPSLSPQVRTAVTTMLQRQISTTEAARTATIKGLDDQFEAVTMLALALPQTYKKDTLNQIAAGYEAVGDKSKAVNARMLASMEETLLNFSGSSREAQDVLKAMLQGKAKELAGALSSASERDAAESTKAARDAFATIKTAVDNNVPLASQTEKIKQAFDLAIKGRDRTLVTEMHDWVTGRAAAEAMGQAPQAAMSQLIAELTDKVRTSDQSAATVTQLDQLNKIQAAQQSALQKDAFAAGTQIYQQVGPAVPINWSDKPENIAATLGVRATQARQITAMSGVKAIPFTQPEIASIKTRLDAAAPDEQAAIMRMLALAPADMLPGIAIAIAGKQGEGDAVSRSYAAALAFYADKDPASQAAADQILKGSQILRADGGIGRKISASDKDFQNALQERFGNSLMMVAAGQQDMVKDAIAATYAYQMARAGRQSEGSIDADVLDRAITTVMGEEVSVRGQKLFPPNRGMTAYQFERDVLGKLTDGDLQGATSKEGDPITADLIRRKGTFMNVASGVYKVFIADPRTNDAPAEIRMPDGRAFLLDGKAMLQRPAPAGPVPPKTPEDARRRAPASPTEGVAP